MSQYDGSIRINTVIDSGNFTIQMRKIVAHIKDIEQEATGLRDRLKQIEDAKIPTKEYRDVQEQIEKTKNRLENLQEQKKEYLALGGSTDSDIFKNMSVEINELQKNLPYLESELQDLVDTGKAFTFGEGSEEEAAQISERLKEISADIEFSSSKLSRMLDAQKNIKAAFEKTVNAAKRLLNSLKKIASTGVRAFLSLFHAQNKSNGGFQTGFKNILKYGLGIRSLFVLFNRLRSAITDGFKNLVQYSNEFNTAASALKSSCTQLKNSFAAAFAPIVQAVIPYLNALIQKIITAMNYIAQFTAFLTGQSTWIKAIAVQEDYAKSLNKTAGAAKKAAGALASFDTLEVLNKKDTSGGAGSISPKDMFEEVPLDFGFDWKDFLNKTADFLEDVDWEEIKDRAEQTGRKIADILNDVWENERLASDIGMTIGEALNAAVRFSHGVIDKTKWKQMGRWLGTLVQSGLDAFDSEFAGKTVGMLVNGIADAIIGFFQTYHAGSVGAEIAGFLNRAIKEVDAEKVGTAISLVVGGIFKEISTFFGDSDFKEIGRKLSDILIKAVTYSDSDGTVGEKIGQAIANMINAGIDFILGANIGKISYALSLFFSDIVVTAVGSIDWFDLLEAVLLAPLNVIVGTVGGIITKIAKLVGASAEDIQALEDMTSNGIKGLMMSFSDLSDYMDKAAEGYTFNVEKLRELQDRYHFVDEDIDSIIQSMIMANENLDLATLGLEGYAGSWEAFNASVVDSTNSVEEATGNMADSATANYDTVIQKASSAKELIGKEHIQIEASLDNTGNKYQEYSRKATDSLDKASESVKAAGTSISELKDESSMSLDNMASKIAAWFSGSVEPYFSEEEWGAFSQNITTVMTECITEFMKYWTESFDLWHETNEELYFGYDIWYEQWENMLLAYLDVNDEFMSDWQSSFDTWWTTMVEPFFELQKWQKFGENMKNGIMQGFKAIVSQVGNIMNQIINIFNSGLKNIETAINDLVNQFNYIALQLGEPALNAVHVQNIPHINIPALADGAVIRGGNPFMAILGDQRAGQTNIEAPASLIEDKVAAGIRSAMGNGWGGGSVHIHVDVDGETLASKTLDNFLSELDRRGFDLSPIGG